MPPRWYSNERIFHDEQLNYLYFYLEIDNLELVTIHLSTYLKHLSMMLLLVGIKADNE